MKKNQMEVMREARRRALEEGVNFHTMNLFHPSGHKLGGNIIAAVKRLSGMDIEIGQVGQALLDMTEIKLYRVQYSFCSPHEKNPSRIFGEGQAALRFFNDKSALVLKVPKGGKLSEGLRLGALNYANMRGVPWLRTAKVKDLV